MAFIRGSYPAEQFTSPCIFCDHPFASKLEKRSFRQLMCCNDPVEKVEAMAHKAGDVYHAFHPDCFERFIENNLHPKCPRCFTILTTVDGQPYAMAMPQQNPEDALLVAAGQGDSIEIASLLSSKHDFSSSILDQAIRLASCQGHNDAVKAILAVHKPSDYARIQAIELAEENFNFALKTLLQEDA